RPDAMMVTGASVIVLSGLYAFYREHLRHRPVAASSSGMPPEGVGSAALLVHPGPRGASPPENVRAAQPLSAEAGGRPTPAKCSAVRDAAPAAWAVQAPFRRSCRRPP